MASIEFTFRTGKIVIDTEKCAGCRTMPCIAACKTYGAGLFQGNDGKFSLVNNAEETGRRCIEDLACEIYCQRDGNKGLRIHLEMFELEDYRKKVGLG